MPFGRRRRRDPDDEETIDLSSPEHAWWAAPENADTDDAATESTGPYAVLGVADSATWDEITAAHRKLVKALHPDQLVNPSDAERERFENAMRDINEAYNELRVRRGR